MTIKEIGTKTEFNGLVRQGVTLVDFNAPWCGPCRSQEPILAKIASDFKGRAIVAAMNVDNNQDIVLELGIRSVPTLIVFKNNMEIQRFVGLHPEEMLSGVLEKLVG